MIRTQTQVWTDIDDHLAKPVKPVARVMPEGKTYSRPIYYIKLASESSAEYDTEASESVYSIQGRETDLVKDTSDTDSKSEYEVQIEYEVDSASDTDNQNFILYSSSEPEDIMIATAVCASDFENFITDCEESDDSKNEGLSTELQDYWACIQCKSQNDNPSFRYCDKCYQDRKALFPPRPKPHKKAKRSDGSPVKLDALKSCLKGLSQDSGLGSSQEYVGTSSSQELCTLRLDKILVPEVLSPQNEKPSCSKKTPIFEGKTKSVKGTTTKNKSRRKVNSGGKKEEIDAATLPVEKQFKEAEVSCRKRLLSESEGNEENSKRIKLQEGVVVEGKAELRNENVGGIIPTSRSRKRAISESTSSDDMPCEQKFPKKQKVTPKQEQEVDKKKNVSSNENGETTTNNSQGVGTTDSSDENCIMCNTEPKNGIFLHGRIGHMCCCYKCAMKTWKSVKRCPVCQRKVYNVIRLYKT